MIQRTEKNRIRLHICITLAVMLFIFIQSAMPGRISGAESNFIVQFIVRITGWNEELLSIAVRKAAHFTEFLVLGICLCVNMRDLMNSKETVKRSFKTACPDMKISTPGIAAKHMLAAWLIGTAYAATDEFHQLFVPGRACSLIDICIDSAGAACGVIAYCIYGHIKSNTAQAGRF